MLKLITWPRNSWPIFSELESLQADMNRVFSEKENNRFFQRGELYPPMNVWSSTEGLVVDAEIAGINPKDLELSVLGDELTLRGKINTHEVDKNETYHRCERPCGDFSRTLKLPFRAAVDTVKARLKNGVLRITVPRGEEDKTKQIVVETE